ncbi:hypothetical protein DL98DRAFT_575425 [Cadophora sp. DSE1049]|nr:hypothetical protein DL98DRAFT_575425 [Cadophora sp. DSE1049]
MSESKVGVLVFPSPSVCLSCLFQFPLTVLFSSLRVFDSSCCCGRNSGMAPYEQPALPLTEIPTAGSEAQHASTNQSQGLATHHSNTNPGPDFPTSFQNETITKAEQGSSTPSSLKPGGRRRRADAIPTTTTSKDDPLNRMGVRYSKIVTYSTGTRYSIYIVPVAILLAIPVIVGTTQVSVSDPKIGGIRVVWFFTWFEAVWLSFWAINSETKKYARVLENLETMITLFGWVVVSFVLYEVLFSTASTGNTPSGWTTRFKQVMAAILVSTINFFIEKILVQLISVSYNARSFNNRIDASKRAVHLLGILFEASRSLFAMYEAEFLEEDFIIHANIEAFVRKGRKERTNQDVKSDGNGDVSLDEMTMRLMELCLERKTISRSMHDVSQAIKALDNVLSSVALLLSIFALICFLDTGFHTILSTASTTLLSLSFVFSVTAQEFLGSCIFLFVKHPYDIGDRVHVSGPDGINQMEVEQISLLYTAFRRVTDLQLIQIPNITLNTLWINNISRSKGLMERTDIFISFDTSIADIETLRQEMERFVTAPENVRDFQPEITLRCVGLGTMDKLQLQLEVRHKSNWTIETIRAARHAKLICAMVLAMRKIPIFGPGGGGAPLGDPSNPSYNVAVSDEIAAAARDKAAKDADAARLYSLSLRELSKVPEGPAGSETLPAIPESVAADSLNAVSLGDAPLRDQELDDDTVSLVGSQTLHKSTSRFSEASGVSQDLQKTKSPQGRRKAGHAAPSSSSMTSRQRTDLETIASRI